MKGVNSMNLYEAVSKKTDVSKYNLENIKTTREEYDSYVEKRSKYYLQIIDICPTLGFDDNDDLDFLSFAYEQFFLSNITPMDAVEIYLTSKGYPDLVDDFNELLILVDKYLMVGEDDEETY